MEGNIFEQFPNREAFDTYWNENYVPVTYEDVKKAYEEFIVETEGHIFLSDYEENGCIAKGDFKENLSQEAQFTFQDVLTEVFYDKNPTLYETAFAIYEESQMNGGEGATIARIYGETFQKLYEEFLDKLFDEKIAK